MCSKRIEFEAVFTKTEMSNEWNIHFLQKMWLVKKYRGWSFICQNRNEQRMKRLFSSKYNVWWKSMETKALFTKTGMNNKWNISFHKIRGVLKTYRGWGFIYQDSNDHRTKSSFFSKYEVCSKSIETGAEFTKIERKNGWNVNFLRKMRSVLNGSFS